MAAQRQGRIASKLQIVFTFAPHAPQLLNSFMSIRRGSTGLVTHGRAAHEVIRHEKWFGSVFKMLRMFCVTFSDTLNSLQISSDIKFRKWCSNAGFRSIRLRKQRAFLVSLRYALIWRDFERRRHVGLLRGTFPGHQNHADNRQYNSQEFQKAQGFVIEQHAHRQPEDRNKEAECIGLIERCCT